MPSGRDIVWVSFDADYIGGIALDKNIYHCVRNCRGCSTKTGRPQKQQFSIDQMIKNTQEMIDLVTEVSFQSIHMRQCHASIVDLLYNQNIVYNIDTHHDKYSNAKTKKDVDCGNWVSWALKQEIKIFNNYSPSRTLNAIKKYRDKIFKLFICTSPNYCSVETDYYLMRILYNIKGKINMDLTK